MRTAGSAAEFAQVVESGPTSRPVAPESGASRKASRARVGERQSVRAGRSYSDLAVTLVFAGVRRRARAAGFSSAGASPFG